MAEQEVIKHTKKIFSVWKDREHGFWHKLKELLLEIFIIVFAISLSIWFHNRSEHKHQQEDVSAFLLGLKDDLKSDISEMESDKASYLMQKKAYSYITNTKLGEKLRMDSLANYYRWIFNATGLNPNNGRFEGFKSSGKIGTIEDKNLQNDIMDLYQENIPMLLNSTNGYVSRKNRLFEYLQKNNRRITDSTSNFVEVLNTEEAHNICAMLTVTEEITARYDIAMAKMNKIIAAIDKDYKTEK